MRITIYDPPGGWRHGFPREYKPLPGETLRQTLIRDGYPEREIIGDGDYCRFWDKEVEPKEFCRYCGAGIGKFKREGEGTCEKCDNRRPDEKVQTVEEKVCQDNSEGTSDE